MNLTIDVADDGWRTVPALEELAQLTIATAWAAAGGTEEDREVSLLFTGDDEVRILNRQWRGKDRPTNVLSFPAEDFPAAPGAAKPLGDIVLACETVTREALDQGKTLPHHAQHLIVHGFLHLLDFDHESDDEAAVMEDLERRILKSLGISDPYE